MSYYQLCHTSTRIAIKSQHRVIFTIPISINQILVVLNDLSYRHYHLISMNIINHQQQQNQQISQNQSNQQSNSSQNSNNNYKLPILPINYFIDYQYSENSVYFYNQQYLCRLDINSYNHIQTITTNNINYQKQTQQKQQSPKNKFCYKYHCQIKKIQFANQNTKYHPIAKNYFLSATPTTDVGLKISCFRFQINKWTQTLSLPKHFIHYKISVPKDILQEKKIQQAVSYKKFYILANGEKYTTINFRKIIVDEKNNVLQSIIVKSINLDQRFIMVGFYTQKFTLHMVGNCMPDGISIARYDLIQQKINIVHLNLKNRQGLVSLKSFRYRIMQSITQMQNSFICVVQKQSKKYIAKVNFIQMSNKYLQKEQIQILNQIQKSSFIFGVDKNCFHSYQLKCQLFLQKLKSAPIILQIQGLAKISKKVLYQVILNQIKIDEELQAHVLDLL